MEIVNVIEIGDKNVKLSDLTDDEKKDIAVRLTIQAMASVGYRAASGR